MADQNWSMHSGDSKSITVTVKDSAGVAVDVSAAATVVYKLAQHPSSTPLITKGLGNGISVATSTVTITFAPVDTADLFGQFYQELDITESDGNEYTVMTGYVLVENDLI